MARDPFRDFRVRPDYIGAFGILETEAGVLLVANRRRISGADRTVWDLPGGGVEPGETLAEALVREMAEETGLAVEVGPALFVAEGERVRAGRRIGVWRSFFLPVTRQSGEITHVRDPAILGHRYVPRADLPALLTAPYHRAFLAFLSSGGALRHAFDRWAD